MDSKLRGIQESTVGSRELRSREARGAKCATIAVLSMFVMLLALALAACSGRTPPPQPTAPVIQTRVVEVTREVVVTATPSPTPGYSSPISSAPGTLTYPLGTLPRHLDPQAADEPDEILVVRQMYEGLFNLREDGRIEPAAASAFTASADARVYTVTLRSGLTWSDGQALRAADFAAGVCRSLEPAVGSSLAYLLTDVAQVRGAKAYASGDSAVCDSVGISAIDDATLRISLEAPAAFLPQLMTTALFLPAPRDSGPITDTVIMTGTVGAPVNGPFVLAERRVDAVVLAKSPDYWNADNVSIGRIELPVVSAVADQLAKYEQGALQIAGFPAEETARIQANPPLARELHVLSAAGVSYFGFNTQRAPTDNPAVRRAVASAMDRARLIEQALAQPWHPPARTLVPPGIPGYAGDNTERGIPFNADEARRLLAEAGYGPENPVPPVEIWYNREGNNELIFEAVATMLEEVGIPVRLVSSAWDVYISALDACNAPNAAGAVKTTAECSYNIYRMGWVVDYPDASSLLRTLSPSSPDQYTGWQDDQYEGLLAATLAEGREARRLELYGEMEDALIDEAVAVVPLLFYDRSLLIKHGLLFEYPVFGLPQLQYWRLRQ